MASPGDELASILSRVRTSLLSVSEATASVPLAPGKWTRKQILGHLIDSAANNHQRFVRVQREDGLALPGYAQDAWVDVQGYDEAPWSELVALWQTYNRHLVRVLHRLPPPALGHQCTVGGGEPVTLAFVAKDYVRHLEHHLAQILGRTS